MSLRNPQTYLCPDPVVLEETEVMVMQRSGHVHEGDVFSVAWHKFPMHILWLREAIPVFKLMHRGKLVKQLATYCDTSGYLSAVESALGDAHHVMGGYAIDETTELELVLELSMEDHPVTLMPEEPFDDQWRGIRVRNILWEDQRYYFDRKLFETINNCTSMQAYEACLSDPVLKARRIDTRVHREGVIVWSSRDDGHARGVPTRVQQWLAQEREAIGEGVLG